MSHHVKALSTRLTFRMLLVTEFSIDSQSAMLLLEYRYEELSAGPQRSSHSTRQFGFCYEPTRIA